MNNTLDPKAFMSVFAATVKVDDEVWYMGAFRRVVRVEYSTPLPGQITWTLAGVAPEPAVAVPATKKVAVRRV